MLPFLPLHCRVEARLPGVDFGLINHATVVGVRGHVEVCGALTGGVCLEQCSSDLLMYVPFLKQ